MSLHGPSGRLIGSTVSGLDYGQVECVQKKRLVAFVNHFLLETASFLSVFSEKCDQRLDKISRRIRRVEQELSLLELKLENPACPPKTYSELKRASQSSPIASAVPAPVPAKARDETYREEDRKAFCMIVDTLETDLQKTRRSSGTIPEEIAMKRSNHR